MRFRVDWPIIGLGLTILGILFYFGRQSTSVRNSESVEEIQSRLHELEDEVHNGQIQADQLEKEINYLQSLKVIGPSPDRLECSFQYDSTPQVDVQMLDVYDRIPFKNDYGGAWTQGWDVTYTDSRWNKESKLKVIVVPHSHNDPGWLETFDEYYLGQTQDILNNMLEQLTINQNMTMIWAEISYFSRWYEQLSAESQKAVKSLLQRKQLEFVTGGWVMTDEANSHWLSTLQELTEGQTWLKVHLNVTPKSSWSIDPFGHSSMLAYLLKGAGFENHLIQRTHYEVKKYLAREKQLEFQWRQPWDENGGSDLFTHMMPFYSYDAPHSCGPDPSICCQFDFKRLPFSSVDCPWGVRPTVINDENVEQKARQLVDQYKKKATLYQSDVLLVPLGDDFRYNTIKEWTDQRTNYEKLFEYINKDESLNVEAKFGTLQEYFDAVRASPQFTEMPTLSGDFFTYSDREEFYWSGYFTTRPFHKHLDRILMNYLRSAEMLHAWSTWHANSGFDDLLQTARRALSLFQHHDGITGTARDHVVRDYYRQMTEALKACKFVIQQAAYRHLTVPQTYLPDYNTTYFDIDDSRFSDENDRRPIITLESKSSVQYIAIHNSLPRDRSSVVEFLVSTPLVKVETPDGRSIMCQITPTWSWNKVSGSFVPTPSTKQYRLLFKANVSPLGLATYIIRTILSAEESTDTVFADIQIFTENNAFTVELPEYPNPIETLPPRDVTVRTANPTLSASFNANGLLSSVSTQTTANFPIHLEFMTYSARDDRETSGAYLFLPDGEAKPVSIDTPRTFVVTSGPFESSCATSFKHIQHETILRDGENSLEIRNLIDIRDTGNNEFVMRLSSAVNSTDTFYTDLNGFQYMKRKRFDKIPLQGNYYPIPSGIYIEDARTRITLLTAQPLGGSSLASGQIEIMQDRRLDQDDGRGLAQGIQDNLPTLNIFKLGFEQINTCTKHSRSFAGGFLTEKMHTEMNQLLHPMEKLIWHGENKWHGVVSHFGRRHQSLEIGTEIAVLRNLRHVANSKKNRKSAMGLIINRYHLEQCIDNQAQNVRVNLLNVLGIKKPVDIFNSTLTMLDRQQKIDSPLIDICPMDIKSFIIDR